MQSKEKFPSSHTPFRFLAFCSTAITERERIKPVKKFKLREDQSIIIFCSCHTLSIYPCVDAMGSDAKWQIGRREAKKKRSRKKKKEEWKKSGKKGKEGKGGKGGEGTETGEGGLGWLYRSTSVWNCLWHCCTTCQFAVWVWSWFETLKPFPASKIAKHYTIIILRAQHLWRISGRWNSCRGSGNTPNVELGPATSVMPVIPVMSVMSSMSWFLLQVSETERIQRTHENACSVMNLTAGSSQSTKNVFRRALGCRVSTAWQTNAVSKTRGTSVLFLEMENRWKYARHGSVAPKMAEKWCRCWQHEPPRFKDGFKMKIKVQNDGLELGNRGEGWCSPALTTFQISSNEMKSFSKWSGI